MEAKLLMGNEACAEGALAAGIRFFGGYPITPSNEICEIMSSRLPQVGGRFIQMEDEISGMASIIGGSVGGLKAMTATSGPGFSLMQENLGLAVMCEVPCVVVNVMRGGPSTGLPTLPSQGDVMQARWGTHGDHPAIALCPASVREVFDLTVTATNLAEKYRMPVVLLMDEVIGHLREKVVLPQIESIEIVDREKPTCPPEWYRPFEDNKRGVPLMAAFGEGYRYHITGLTHDEHGFPTTKPEEVNALMQRLHRKVRQGFEEIMMYETFLMDDAETAIVAYGSVVRSAKTAVLDMRQQGKKVGLLKLTTIWPFPRIALESLPEQVQEIFVPEMNLGQLYREVVRVCHNRSRSRKRRPIGSDCTPVNAEEALKRRRRVHKISKVTGELITPEEIIHAIKREGAGGA
ncbi:MAG: 2-oxoacid:acceptor oxidoreductase subunit alpha [Deltaproteobacteria bacterium]|nr:2-oxoacid:acceptor oxidoreductase subunit alpha [Deltaproteobacteria bacterium]